MILAVLLKQVEFVYARSGRDPADNFVRPTDTVFLNNPADEAALEQAVQLKESMGEGQVWVLSLGKRPIEKEARRALAMGADHFVHLGDSSWGELDAWATAEVLSRAVSKTGADMVLCGTASLDDGRSEVGQYVAGLLSVPYIQGVVKLSVRPDGRSFLVERALGKGDREELEADLPLVMGVDKGLCEPRYPSRVKTIEAQSRSMLLWRLDDLGLGLEELGGLVRVGPLQSPRPRTKHIPLLDGRLSASERIEWLFSISGQDKGGLVLEGEPGELAQRFVEFLREKKLSQVEEGA